MESREETSINGVPACLARACRIREHVKLNLLCGSYFTYIDKSLVLWILTVRGENAKESLLTVESLADFVKSLDES